MNTTGLPRGVLFVRSTAFQLKPISVDFQAQSNRVSHHTDEYENQSLIVRRGQEFNLIITFDRELNSQDKVILQFVTGKLPKQGNNTLVRIREGESLITTSWGMKLSLVNGPTVHVTVMSAAEAIVGEYSVYVETRTKSRESGEELTYRIKHSESMYILFNAWCKDDAVYMDKEQHRSEYVLSDHGLIWVGSSRNNHGIPWNFGQFEDISLETSLILLDKVQLSDSARSNAVRVSRVISQMANFNDRDGRILFGRWTEDYPTGTTRPTEWTGSVDILEKYDRGVNTVKYGQCWVFSGLVTTLLRAIGIPTRCVTNFDSAHDTDASLTIDFHSDENGKPLNDLDDSVWNFHVWNESFFTRPDLPDGYDGWQVLDSTPQEKSDGLYRCGPCPVKAVKNGEVYLPHDTGFVFAEVNGDRVYWEVKKDGQMDVIGIDKRSVGKNISTKAVGSNAREDLTLSYKHKDGSAAERKAVHLANKFSSRRKEEIYKNLPSYDVTFKAVVENNINIGDDFTVKLIMGSTSKEQRMVKVDITLKVTFYTGVVAKDLKELSDEVILKPAERNENVVSSCFDCLCPSSNDSKPDTEQSVALHVKPMEYLKMAPDMNITVYFNAYVKETGQAFVTRESVEFVKPILLSKFHAKEITKNEEFQMTIYFTNPLPISLTNGVFHVEASLMKPRTQVEHVGQAIASGGKAAVTVTLTPQWAGKRYVDASFQCDQLSGIRGEFEVLVQ